MLQPDDLIVQHRENLLGFTITVDSNGDARLLDSDDMILYEGSSASCLQRRLELLSEQFSPMRHTPRPTLGGKQFWADIFCHCGWRIQEHVISGLTRLLDPKDRQIAYGSWASVRTTYEQLRLEHNFTPVNRDVVVILHGLIRAKDSMHSLECACREVGFEVLNLNYPSTRRPIADHAAQLNLALNNSRDIGSVSFVTHSLGAMVVRQALAEQSPWRDRIEIKRHLMIFPPNRGSKKANRWKPIPIARWVMGPSLTELTTDDADQIPPPGCPFAIIAGHRDTTVLPEEAQFDNADGFIIIDAEHTFGMNHPDVVNSAVQYIMTGQLSHPQEPL